MKITLPLLMLIALVLFAVPAAAYESEDGSFQTEVRRVETECPFSLPEDEVLNKTVVCGELTDAARRDLILGLIAIKYTQSNSVGYALDGQMIGIALTLYQRDNGRWPDALQDLTPRYLPGVTLPAEIVIGSDPAEILEGAEVILSVVPTQFVRLLRADEGRRAAFKGDALKVVWHGAAPCSPEVKRQMIEWWGPIIHEYYAGTEGNGFCYTNSEDWLAHKGSVGRPLLSEVHIVDAERVDPLGASSAAMLKVLQKYGEGTGKLLGQPGVEG